MPGKDILLPIYIEINHQKNEINKPLPCCHSWRVRLECGRLWIRSRSGKAKDNKIVICCFSSKQATLRSMGGAESLCFLFLL